MSFAVSTGLKARCCSRSACLKEMPAAHLATEHKAGTGSAGRKNYIYTHSIYSHTMRKSITFFATAILLLAAFVTPRTLCAEEVVLSGAPTAAGWADNTVWYTIQSLQNNAYLGTEGDYLNTNGNLTFKHTETPAATDAAAMWCVVDNGDGSVTLYNAAGTRCQMLTVNGLNTQASAELYFSDYHPEGITYKFYLKPSTMFNTDDVRIIGTQPGTAGSHWYNPGSGFTMNASNAAAGRKGYAFRFTRVNFTPDNAIKAQYILRDEAHNAERTQVEDVTVGAAISPALPDFYVLGTCQKYTTSEVITTVPQGGGTILVNVSPAYPFSEGKFYLLAGGVGSTTKCATYVNNSLIKAGSRTTSEEQLWGFEQVQGSFNQFYIRNVNAGPGMYLNMAKGSETQGGAISATATSTKQAFSIVKYNGSGQTQAFYILGQGSTDYLCTYNSLLTCTGQNMGEDGVFKVLGEGTAYETRTYTYRNTQDGTQYSDKVYAVQGSANPDLDVFHQNWHKSSTTGDCVYTYNGIRYPFELSTDATKHYYALFMNTADDPYYVTVYSPYWITSGSMGNNVVTMDDVSESRDFDYFKKCIWYFKRDEKSGLVYVYNAYDNTALTVNTNSDEMPVQLAAEGSGFKIGENSTSLLGPDGFPTSFNLLVPGNKGCIGDYHPFYPLIYHSDTYTNCASSEYARFTVQSVDEAVVLDAAKACIVSEVPITSDIVNDTYYSEEEVASLAQASTYNGLLQAAQNFSGTRVEVSTNKVYSLKFMNADRFTACTALADKDGNLLIEGEAARMRTLPSASSEVGTMSTLFRFTESDDHDATNQHYLLRHLNSGMYLGGLDAEGCAIFVTDRADAHTYAVEWSQEKPGETLLRDVTEGAARYLCNMANASAEQADVNSAARTESSGAVAEGNKLQVKETPTYKVSINGDAKHATLCLPFPVELPSGVNAYYISGCDNKTFELSSFNDWVADGPVVIAANTPAILNADITTTTTFELPIRLGTAGVHPTDAILLKGTGVKRTGMVERSYYVLANKSQGLGFYISVSPTFKANSAFIPADALSSYGTTLSQGYTFRWKDQSTGIDAIDADAADQEVRYFDLQGRPVLYPTHGIFINSKGQKVLIP